MMVDDTIIAINKSLQDIDYRGTVTFAGFGEPLLQKNLKKHVQLLSNNVQLKQIKLITNGDFLTQKTAFQLIDAGVNCIKISMYDVDDTERYEAFLYQYSHVERIYKHYYNGLPEEVEVNRTELWKEPKRLNIERACYLPFYKMFIKRNYNWLYSSKENFEFISQNIGLTKRDFTIIIYKPEFKFHNQS